MTRERRIRVTPDGTVVDDDALDRWKAAQDAASRRRNAAVDAAHRVTRLAERRGIER